MPKWMNVLELLNANNYNIKNINRPWIYINCDSEDMDQLNLIEHKIQPAIATDWTQMIGIQMPSALIYKIASHGSTVGE